MNDRPSEALVEAVASLWRIPAPYPEQKLRSMPAFKWLSKTVQTDYSGAHTGDETRTLDFALVSALRALGLPCCVPVGQGVAPGDPQEAARCLDRAIRATRCRRRHLVPLDRAGELPAVTLGPARLARFSEADLRKLVNTTCLERVFPDAAFDASRLSMFQWLVVEEDLPLDRELAARSMPLLFEPTHHDFGQIEPYKGRFPLIVEIALFALLLAPWEKWSTALNWDWRGFSTPWVYTVVEDMFAPPQFPISADTLAWASSACEDEFGETVEAEFPMDFPLDENAARYGLALFDSAHWSTVERALGSPLFETPVAHFFVRAFLSEGIDEFLAHLTTIEAALGLHADYYPRLRPKPDPHKSLNATERLARRVAALLEDSSAADQHERLFDIRSCYLHGRRIDAAISSKERIQARALA